MAIPKVPTKITHSLCRSIALCVDCGGTGRIVALNGIQSICGCNNGHVVDIDSLEELLYNVWSDGNDCGLKESTLPQDQRTPNPFNFLGSVEEEDDQDPCLEIECQVQRYADGSCTLFTSCDSMALPPGESVETGIYEMSLFRKN